MKILIVFLISMSILISSCSSTHQLLNYTEIKDEIEDENVLIILKNGKEVEGKIININVDSTFKKSQISEDIILIPASEIKEINTRNHSKGALYGFLYGTGIVVIVAAPMKLIGIRLQGLGGAMIAVAAASASVFGGLIGGAIQGYKNKYVFNSSISNECIKLEASNLSGRFSYFLRPKLFIKIDMIRPEKFMTLSWEGNSIGILIPLPSGVSNEENINKALYLAAKGKFKEASYEFRESLIIESQTSYQ